MQMAEDGDADGGDGDADGVSLGVPAVMVEDVAPGSPGTRRAIPSRRTVPAVTTVFATLDVPCRRHRPTSPKGRQSRSPGTMANQVCHHGLGARVEADDSRKPGVAALGDAGREGPDQLTPSQ